MPILTLERQRELHNELQLLQRPALVDKVGAASMDTTAKIAALARIVAELLAAFGHATYTQEQKTKPPKP